MQILSSIEKKSHNLTELTGIGEYPLKGQVSVLFLLIVMHFLLTASSDRCLTALSLEATYYCWSIRAVLPP